jgi:hypothetical protein
LFAKVDFSLEAEEVFTALVNYLDYPITDGLDFPLAISADATAFCILRTLYVVQEGHIPSESKLLVEHFSPVEAGHQDFTWTAKDDLSSSSPSVYNFHFSPSNEFLALHESCRGRTNLTIFECSSTLKD